MNPTQGTPSQRVVSYNADRLDEMYELLDGLHSAASDDRLPYVTTRSEGEVLDMLRELIYTAQETVKEIEAKRCASSPTQDREAAPARILHLPALKKRNA